MLSAVLVGSKFKASGCRSFKILYETPVQFKFPMNFHAIDFFLGREDDAFYFLKFWCGDIIFPSFLEKVICTKENVVVS